jgi:hypothetical protein
MKTNDEIQNELDLFLTREWSKEKFETWYGLDFDDPPTKRILVQAACFAGTEDEPSEFGAGPFDHWHFEKFLQRRELVPLAAAAAEWAMTVEDFRRVVEAFRDSDAALIVAGPGDATSIVHRSFLRDFHKGFDRLRRSLFANNSAFIQRIHREIREVLHVEVCATKDLTDEALGVEPSRPGYRIDCLTGEAIGLGREVYLETRKPIELAPDCCSWLTFANHESLLRPHMLGTRPGLDQATLERLRQAP